MLRRIEAKLAKFTHAFFYFLVWSIHFLMFSPFLRFRVIGAENIPKRGRYIVAANHCNFFDGFLAAYPFGPLKKISFLIAKRSLKLKIWQILGKLIGSVLLENEAEGYQRALMKLNRILSHGGRVGIFPEGDVSKQSVPRKFKAGVVKLSIDSKTRVIPICLIGTYNLRYFRYCLKRPEILIKIGKPIDLYNYSVKYGNNLDSLASFLREKVVELMDDEKVDNVINISTLTTKTEIRTKTHKDKKIN